MLLETIFPMLSSAAQLEREELLLRLQHFRITPTRDEITWLRTATSFTVSSLYKFLSHTPSPTSALKNMWTIKALLRVMIFTWLMLNNCLTTIDNLARRGWYLPNMCVMCKENEESVTHLFQHCSIAKEIRSYIYSTFAAQFDIPAKFAAIGSIEMLTDPKENNTARNWEITTCFVLWREMCRRIFSDKISSQLSLIREIRTEYDAWFAHTLTGTASHSG